MIDPWFYFGCMFIGSALPGIMFYISVKFYFYREDHRREHDRFEFWDKLDRKLSDWFDKK